jgi:hypothetical protein
MDPSDFHKSCAAGERNRCWPRGRRCLLKPASSGATQSIQTTNVYPGSASHTLHGRDARSNVGDWIWICIAEHRDGEVWSDLILRGYRCDLRCAWTSLARSPTFLTAEMSSSLETPNLFAQSLTSYGSFKLMRLRSWPPVFVLSSDIVVSINAAPLSRRQSWRWQAFTDAGRIPVVLTASSDVTASCLPASDPSTHRYAAPSAGAMTKMKNQPGLGPTRQDKTTERMAQERKSPGATTRPGHSADTPDKTPGHAPASSRADNLDSSANTAARRGDSVASESTDPRRPTPPAI